MVAVFERVPAKIKTSCSRRENCKERGSYRGGDYLRRLAIKRSYKYNHICKNCGKEFVGSSGISYCSSECKREAQRKRSKLSLTEDEKKHAALLMVRLGNFKQAMQCNRKININMKKLRSWWEVARGSKIIISG